MKKFSKILSLFLSFAVMLSFFTAYSPKPKAAESNQFNLIIDGRSSQIYSGNVGFTPGQTLFNIMDAELKSKNITFLTTSSAYGRFINTIGADSGTMTDWWHIYINDKSSEVGVDSIKPENGDKVVLYIGSDDDILYPQVTVTPANPIEDQTVTIDISSTYTDYSGTEPVNKTVVFPGTKVHFNGEDYTAGSDSSVHITMPKAGNYTFTVEKPVKDSVQALVNIGEIPLTVSQSGSTAPQQNDSDNKTPTTQQNTQKADTSAIDSIINSGSDFLLKQGVTDWGAALALSSADRSVPESFFESAAEEISQGDVLPTHLAGIIIGIKAAGGNPRNFNGQDLVGQLLSSNIGQTGLNGYTYSLLAVDSGNYDISASSEYSRENLISSILSYQKQNGAFSLDKSSAPESDMTAIAITALAPYVSESRVKTAVDSAVSYLSSVQQADGGYLPVFSSKEVCESTSQVIIALASVGIDPKSDSRFIKSGNSTIDALLSFRAADGGFEHIKGGGSDYVATEQAVLALSAYRALLKKASRVFDLSGIAVPAATLVKVNNPDTGSSSPVFPLVLLSSVSIALIIKLKRK